MRRILKKVAVLGLGAGLALASPSLAAAAEEWATLSTSTQDVYLIDLADIRRDEDVATVRVARVLMDRSRDEDGYQIQTLEFRCQAKQSRNPLTVDYGPDGAELGRYADADAAWDPIPAGSLDDFTRQIACDAARPSDQTWPTIQAFMATGRG